MAHVISLWRMRRGKVWGKGGRWKVPEGGRGEAGREGDWEGGGLGGKEGSRRKRRVRNLC